ncbi:MAG: EamA family transporter, partial [Gammaproteobacteria bacterium]|nr:EamA family transporter [Gammaproteobacteria bacterium]
NIRQKPLTAISIYFLAALIASFISMLYFSGFAAPTDRQTALAILLNGVLVNGFSYLFWIGALRAAEASYIAPFTYLAPIVSAFYLIVFFDEPFLAAYGIGLLLVVGGGLVNALAKDR